MLPAPSSRPASSAATVVPLDPNATRSEYELVFRTLEPRIVIVEAGVAHPAADAARIARVPVLEAQSQLEAGAFTLNGRTGYVSAATDAVRPEDYAYILSTSGTTEDSEAGTGSSSQHAFHIGECHRGAEARIDRYLSRVHASVSFLGPGQRCAGAVELRQPFDLPRGIRRPTILRLPGGLSPHLVFSRSLAIEDRAETRTRIPAGDRARAVALHSIGWVAACTANGRTDRAGLSGAGGSGLRIVGSSCHCVPFLEWQYRQDRIGRPPDGE